MLILSHISIFTRSHAEVVCISAFLISSCLYIFHTRLIYKALLFFTANLTCRHCIFSSLEFSVWLCVYHSVWMCVFVYLVYVCACMSVWRDPFCGYWCLCRLKRLVTRTGVTTSSNWSNQPFFHACFFFLNGGKEGIFKKKSTMLLSVSDWTKLEYLSNWTCLLTPITRYFWVHIYFIENSSLSTFFSLSSSAFK